MTNQTPEIFRRIGRSLIPCPYCSLTHFGVRLPDPSASLAQATAANRSHDCYPEGFKDVMMRFFNPGLSREHKLAKNYTNAAGRWPNFEMKDIACLLYAS